MPRMQPFWWFLANLQIEFDEPLDDAYFKCEGEVWLAAEQGAYVDDEGQVWFSKFFNDEVEPFGGAYFDRD